MEILIGVVILIDGVNLMLRRLIVNLRLFVRNRHYRVVRVKDWLRLNRRPVVWFRVVEWFRRRLVNWLNLGNMVDWLGRMISWLWSMVDRLWSMVDRLGSMVDRLGSLIEGFVIIRPIDVEMVQPTLYTVHSVTSLVDRLRDIWWSRVNNLINVFPRIFYIER